MMLYQRGKGVTQKQDSPINSACMEEVISWTHCCDGCVLYRTTVSFHLWTAGSWGACSQADTWVGSKRKYLGRVETGWDVLRRYYIQHSFLLLYLLLFPLILSLPVLLNNLAVSSKTQKCKLYITAITQGIACTPSHTNTQMFDTLGCQRGWISDFAIISIFLGNVLLIAKPHIYLDKNKQHNNYENNNLATAI